MEPVDDRWDDPNKIPLSNGPFRATTPPPVADIKLKDDGQIIEFLLPYPMHVVDNADWPALQLSIAGCPVKIRKPIPATNFYNPDGRLGNESPDAFCTILQVFSAPQTNVKHPNPDEVWPIIESLLEWIRIKARHYWLLHGSAGFGALFRGSVIARNIGYTGQQNFSSYGPNVIVRPLCKALWLTMTTELTNSTSPPVSEAIFCDALLSIVAGDDLKALLELGVACEIEITQLLDSVTQQEPKSPEKSDYINKKGDYAPFSTKLQKSTVKLGIQNPEDFIGENIPTDWVTSVKELYGLRNRIAHSGKIDNRANLIGKYIMATNALFKYSRTAKIAAGLGIYTMPTSNEVSNKTIIFRDGRFSSISHTNRMPK